MASISKRWYSFVVALIVLFEMTTVTRGQVPGAPQSSPIAIVGAVVHPVSGPDLADATILFDQGKIVAVGTQVELPAATVQIDGRGKHVYPGLFNVGGELGLVEINSIRATQDSAETGELNPNVRVQVAVNPDSELIPVTRANGVLLNLSVPKGGLISGMSAVLQLDGWTWEQMTIRAPAAMHIDWPAANLDRLEMAFEEAQRYRTARDAGTVVEGSDPRWEAMIPVLKGDVPVVAVADSRQQIQSAVAFADRKKLKLIIQGGYDAEECAALLKDRDVPVIVSAVFRLPRRRSDPFDAAYTLPERLRQAGVRFCISGVDRFEAANIRNLPYHAATAVAYGLPREEALRAITLSPAQILGIAERVGSLEAGKDATLFVADGDPLETATQVTVAFVQGSRVDLETRHTRLWKKYQEKYRQLNK